MLQRQIGLLLAALAVAATGAAPALAPATGAAIAKVVRDASGAWRLVRAGHADFVSAGPALAWGSYTNSVNTTGWGLLEVHGNASASDADMAFAAGFFEGAIMADVPGAGGAPSVNVIYDHVRNTGADADLGPALDAWLAANRAYVADRVASNPGDAYWFHVGLVFTQLDGLNAGYSAAAPSQPLPAHALLAVNLVGDLFDLIPAVGGPTAALPHRSRASHCSALIRWLPDRSDILAAHTTWAGLETMLRTYKMYDLPYTLTGDVASGRVPAGAHIQSSYPGSLYSTDDHYVASSGLIIIETTIGNNNASLYADVRNTSVLEWVRNLVANRLAADGEAWTLLFSRENSGTYNNEWMVVDTNRFVPGAAKLAPGTLWVLDQMPGNIAAADLTAQLQAQGFFSSYNVPFFPAIFNVSNQQALVDEYGDFFTHDKTSRALIFDREAPRVVDLDGMKRVMRFNDWQSDPLATMGCSTAPGQPSHSAVNAISDRADLNDKAAVYPVPDVGYGDSAGIDSKIASAVRSRGGVLGVWAQSGPTHDVQPAFSWANTSLTGLAHAGHPTVWDFGWVQLAW